MSGYHSDTYGGSGVSFARYAKALAIGRGDPMAAEAYAQGQAWHATPGVLGAIKGLIDPMSTADISSATRAVATDFAEYLRARTVFGRLAGKRRVPFSTRMLNATGGASAGWIGEGKPIPVSEAVINDAGIQLAPLKLGGISVLTMELVRHSSPAAEGLIARDVAAGVIAAMDLAFINPDAAGVVDESPASITYGATSFESSGSDVAAIDHDLALLLGVLTAAEMSLDSAAWIMTPATATALSLMRGSGGAQAFQGMSPRGGTLLDLPVLTSTQAKASGSPAESVIALVEASEVLYADDGESEISITSNAAVQMDDAPSAGAQQMVSLWQNGLVGIRGIRSVNWERRRTGCAAVLRSVQY